MCRMLGLALKSSSAGRSLSPLLGIQVPQKAPSGFMDGRPSPRFTKAVSIKGLGADGGHLDLAPRPESLFGIIYYTIEYYSVR